MKNLLSLILSISLFSAIGQINPKTKWGQVSQEEIDYSQVPFEKDAGAVVLYEKGYMNMRNPIETTVYRRIKILNDNGIEEANRKMTFQHLNKLENISGLKAQTINVENGKPVVYEVKKNEFYYTKMNDVFTSVNFAFPNVKAGSVIEYEYTLTSGNLRWINAWYFQDRIPTLYSTVTINPQGLNAGFATIAVGELFVRRYNKKQDGGNQHQWSLVNIPSYTKTNFLYNPQDQRERLILQLKKYYKWKDTYYSDSPELVEITTKWTDLVKEIEDRQNSFNNPSFAKSLIQEIPMSNDSFSYLKNIVGFFKANYSWDGYTSTLPIPEMTNRRLHNEKRGNVADLNLHLYSLLKAAGFDVKLVLLSTRSHGKIITTYPYLGQFNSVINLVTLKDEKSYFIDASDLSNEIGYMPLKNYNQYGLIVDSKNETFISIDPPLSEFYSTQNYVVANDQLMLIKTSKTNGYFNQKSSGADHIVLPSMELPFNEKNKTNPAPIDEKYTGTKETFESGDWQRQIITLQNPLVKILKTYQFDEETREKPVEFDFPLYYKIQTVVKIPENYTAEIPESFQSQQKASEDHLVYFQNAEVKDGLLQVVVELYIDKSIFSNQYKEVRDFFRKANIDASKAILLKKN